MAKAAKTIAIVAGSVALIATGIGAAAGIGALTLSTAAAGTIATVSTVASVAAATASIAASQLAKQSKAPFVGRATQINIGSNQPQPYAIGRTYVGGNLILDVGYGGTVDKVANPYLAQAYIWSGAGPVQEIESFQADFSPIPFSGTAATGYYGGSLWLSKQLGLTPQPAALAGPFGAIPDWSSSHKLSGYAAGLLSAKLNKDGKVFASGLPQFGAVLKGVMAYDPRKDSTYPGGSGAHRWDDESTWEYSQNPGLHGLTYARGRYQNGKKVFGCGIRREGIDVASWVDFANVCDANEWKVGGVLYEPGSRWSNLKRICEAAAAEPVWVGGRLSVKVSSPRVALDTITADDLAPGDYVVPAMRSWKGRKNGLIPKYRSELHKWEYVQSDLVSVGTYVTEDRGEEKNEEYPIELCQWKDQAAQVTAYKLVNAREFGPIVLPCKPRLIEYKIGEALEVDLPELGLDGQLCVIIGRRIDPATAIIELTLESETTAKHDFALGRTGTAPPTPSITSGEEVDAVVDLGVRTRGDYDDGEIYYQGQIVQYAGSAWEYVAAEPTSGNEPPTLPTTENDHWRLFAASGVGTPGIVGLLSNESHTLAADESGNVGSYAGATGQFQVFSGLTDVSSSFALSTAPVGGNPQSLTVNYSSQTYTVTAGFDAGEDTALLVIRATGSGAYAGITIDKVFSLAKSKTGAIGADAKLIVVTSTHQTFRYDSSDAPLTQTTTFTASRQNTSNPTLWTLRLIDGTIIVPTETAANMTAGVPGFSTTGNDNLSLTAAGFQNLLATYSTNGIILQASTADGISDSIGVVKVRDGQTGPTGPSGAGGFTITKSGDDVVWDGSALSCATGAGWGTKGAYSNQRFAGGCTLAYRGPGTYGAEEAWIIGLNADPAASHHFNDIDHGMVHYWHAESETYRLAVYESGDQQPMSEQAGALFASWNGGVSYSIRYDGTHVLYYSGSELLHKTLVGAGKAFGLDYAVGIKSHVVDVAFHASGSAGLSVAELTVFKRASSAPSTPSGGTYDFSPPVLLPPEGWSLAPPSGTEPLWAARGVASSPSLSSVTPSWYGVGKIAEDGEDGLSGEGVDVIFRRSATQPSTPSPSAGVPGSWYTNTDSVPAGDDPVWASFGFRPIGDTVYTWQTPKRIEGLDGTPGAPGAPGSPGSPGANGNRQVMVFARSATQPATPSGAGLPFGWTETQPTTPADQPLWMTRSVQDDAGTTLIVGWSAPILFEALITTPATIQAVTIPFDGVSGSLFLTLANGEGRSISGRVRHGTTSGSGSSELEIEYRQGGGSWTTLDTETDSYGPGEIVSVIAGGMLTNSTGDTRIYELRALHSVTGTGPGTEDATRCYLQA